jgi:hypothetical protein
VIDLVAPPALPEDRMASRIRIIAAALALVAVAGCSRDSNAPVAKPPLADRPEAVSQAWLAAMDKGDFKGMVACLAPETVREQATDHAWWLLELRDGLERSYSKDRPRPREGDERRRKQRAEAARKVNPMLLEYGLTTAVSGDLKRLPKEAARKALAEKIRDPAGFLIHYLEVTYDKQPLWRKEKWPAPYVDGVVITGDKAEGRLIYLSNRVDKGDERREFKKNISFVKLPDGNWRVVDDYTETFFLRLR